MADFEDNDTINTPTGNNHPVLNATGSVIPNNTWTHVAATYDGTSWALYVNGNLETTETEGARYASTSTRSSTSGSEAR